MHVGGVSRRSLIDPAIEGGARLVTVTAPAGYGKSTLLTEWAEIDQRRLVRIDARTTHDDPAALLDSAIAAFEELGVLGPAQSGELRGSLTAALQRAAPMLAAHVRSAAAPFVLLIDDLQNIHATASLDVLDVVLAGIPAGSQAVVASRVPSARLGRGRTRGDLVTIGTGDLRMDATSAITLFAAARQTLTPAAADELIARTDGWPVALAISARSLEERPRSEPGDRPEGFFAELYDSVPESARDLLRRTSILDELSGPLCDAVLGTTGSGAILGSLADSNALVIRSADAPGRFLCHDLLRDFLSEELRRLEPELVETLQDRAATWFEEQGELETALEHRLRMSDRSGAVQLFEQIARPTYEAGRQVTSDRWLSALGDETLQQQPQLALLAAWNAMLNGHDEQSDRWAAIVTASAGAVAGASKAFDVAYATLSAVRLERGIDEAYRAAVVATGPDADYGQWKDTAHWALGEIQLLRGERDTAQATFELASALGSTQRGGGVVVVAEAALAIMAIEDGDWAKAKLHAQTAIGVIQRRGHTDYASSATAYAVACRVAQHRGDEATLFAMLHRATRSRSLLSYSTPVPAVVARLQLASVGLAQGDAAGVRQLLSEIGDIVAMRPALSPYLRQADELRASLAAGRLTSTGLTALTLSELRILPLLQTHLTVDEISHRLFVSRNTAATHIGSIYRKLHVNSRSEAVERGIAVGLLGR